MPPNPATKHVPGFTLKVEGSNLDPKLMDGVTEIRVRDSLSLPAAATVKISDPALENVDGHPLQIGRELEILLAAAGSISPAPVFKGEIVSHEPEFDEEGCTIVVRAYDKSHRLQRGKKVRTFQQMSASDMVKRITEEAGLTGTAEPTNEIHEFFQQSDETDRDFIRRFERRYDFEFVMEDGSYRFRSAKKDTGAVTLKYGDGTSLLNFRPRVSSVQQAATVVVRGWDPAQKQEIVGQGVNGTAAPTEIGAKRPSVVNSFGVASVLVADRTVETRGEADKLAQASLDRAAAAFVEAEGKAYGNPDIKAGKLVKLEGLGARFSGQYKVTAATHVLRGAGSYFTLFQISGRSERGLLDLMHRPEPREWGQQLVVGVVSNVNDPKNLGRVRVKYPALSASDESAWARVITHSAGNERGIYMLPQANEEVVIAFENGDTRRPLVVGSLFNGKDKPGDDLLQNKDGSFAVKSNEKALIHTKKDLTFKSDENMIIEVKKDQNVKVEGKREEAVTANVKLKAGSSYEIEAGSSFSIKGVSIEVKASGPLTLSGATVEIKSDGPASFKGAIVDINATGVANLKGSMVNIG
ncbi:MAG: VgrG-related protein [Solirubrobacteraceae bacterium]